MIPPLIIAVLQVFGFVIIVSACFRIVYKLDALLGEIKGLRSDLRQAASKGDKASTVAADQLAHLSLEEKKKLYGF